jgi:hypothetical protein
MYRIEESHVMTLTSSTTVYLKEINMIHTMLIDGKLGLQLSKDRPGRIIPKVL